MFFITLKNNHLLIFKCLAKYELTLHYPMFFSDWDLILQK